MSTYRIVCFFADGDRPSRAVKGKVGLSLEEAREHCRDPRTRKRNKRGEVVWFDGFTVEDET